MKQNGTTNPSPMQAVETSSEQIQTQSTELAIPHLLDLGAGKCVPCRMMKPILETLTHEYAGQMRVTFIDVWENPDAGEKYGIRIIPTQIFYDAQGKELFRHEGFYSKEEILSKWKELGITLPEPTITTNRSLDQTTANHQDTP
ncbi:MAG TPA: thioredoxin [Phycisphaerales bacterium]|nr:thioredoxin [Phycisphaerales bacterium]HCD34471.1 thioredoxin [Phycisphaerales bacterium]